MAEFADQRNAETKVNCMIRKEGAVLISNNSWRELCELYVQRVYVTLLFEMSLWVKFEETIILLRIISSLLYSNIFTVIMTCFFLIRQRIKNIYTYIFLLKRDTLHNLSFLKKSIRKKLSVRVVSIIVISKHLKTIQSMIKISCNHIFNMSIQFIGYNMNNKKIWLCFILMLVLRIQFYLEI